MARKMLRNVEKRGVQAARNGPSEDRKCWQCIELGIHGLKSWGRNWSRKVRETRSSSSHQCSKKNRFSPLAAAQPLSILSWPEALNASGSRRARRMAISRNVSFLLALPDFPEFAPAVRYGVPGTPEFAPAVRYGVPGTLVRYGVPGTLVPGTLA